MSGDKDIKSFVQGTLGCGCPEKVFESIECLQGVAIDGIRVRNRINVGNRLLIYVADADHAGTLKEMLTALVVSGRKERDSMGFNRFRLVLTADDTDKIRKEAEEIFRSVGGDEKVHLHLVRRSDIHI